MGLRLFSFMWMSARCQTSLQVSQVGWERNPSVIWTLDGDKRVKDCHRSQNPVPQQQVDEWDPLRGVSSNLG